MKIKIQGATDDEVTDGARYEKRLVAEVFNDDNQRVERPTVQWRLTAAPTGMRIDPRRGDITWTAKYVKSGVRTRDNEKVKVEARNLRKTATASFSIRIHRAAPVIDDIADLSLDDKEQLAHQVTTSGGTGDPTWGITGPKGMTIDANGLIKWKCAYAPDPYHITVRAKNDKGAVEKRFRITVRPLAPVVDDIPDLEVDDDEVVKIQPKLREGSGTIIWGLPERPDGMTIDGDTGAIRWEARWAGEAPVQVTVRATGVEAQCDKTFEIQVLPIAPKLEPIQDKEAEDLAWYVPKLSFKGSGDIRFELLQGPPGSAVVEDSGQVSWQGRFSDSPAAFELKATGPGGEDSIQWTVNVRAQPPVAARIDDRTLDEGEAYREEIGFTQGTGEIELLLEGAPNGLLVSTATNQIFWITKLETAGKKRTVNLKLTAKGGGKKATRTWKIVVRPVAVEEEAVLPCQRAEPAQEEPAGPCCNPTLTISCKHVGADDDLRAGTHGWAGFYGSPFPGVNPRDYKMVLPIVGEKKPNEKPWDELSRKEKRFYQGDALGRSQNRYPVYQVQAGPYQNPDEITVVVEHEAGCPKQGDQPKTYIPIVGSLEPVFKWKTRRRQDERELGKGWKAVFPAPAKSEYLPATELAGLDGIHALVRLNPLMWHRLKPKRWQVKVLDLDDLSVVRSGDPAQALIAEVQAFPDIRWEVNVTLAKSSDNEEGGKIDISTFPPSVKVYTGKNGDLAPKVVEKGSWTLTGLAKCTFDDYVFSLEADLLDNIQQSLPFLKTIDALGTILEAVSATLPVGMNIGLRGPSLTFYVAAEPYEQVDRALEGYQFKVGFYAAPLIGIEIEWNLLYFILASFPATMGAVVVLQALQKGIGVSGVAKVKVEVGIYLIAGGQIGLELEWAHQWPDGNTGYGLADVRVDFKIEGRVTLEAEVLIVNAGAGVKVGAKTAVGLCGKAEYEDGMAFKGQARWEGIVLYALAYYKAGIKIGPLKITKGRTKSSTLVIAKPHYAPKAPKPHKIGGSKSGQNQQAPPPVTEESQESSEENTQSEEGLDMDELPQNDFDVFKGKGDQGAEVSLTEEQAETVSGVNKKKNKRKK